MQHIPRIAIFGAGNIGCYVGGRLLVAGCDVVFIGREHQRDEIKKHGLRITDYLGSRIIIAGADIEFATEAQAATNKDLVIVTVKSASTIPAALELDHLLKPHSAVLSLQNGIRNVRFLEEHMPEQTVLAGMTPFNVAKLGPGEYHQGSEGDIMVQNDPALISFQPWFELAGIPLELSSNMDNVLYGKMLLNLNNPINALADIPLKEQLSDRNFRRCLAAAQREALSVFEKMHANPQMHFFLPPSWLPDVLEMPNLMFTGLANKLLQIDPLARSSMWEDLAANRVTEIDYLNGEIVRLGVEYNVPTPVNRKLVELIRLAEQGQRKRWAAEELLATLQSA